MNRLEKIVREIISEKKKKRDRCLRIADRKYDKPSAYKSGSVVRCRKGQIWKGLKEEQVRDAVAESLRNWFKKEDWVRINTSGNITGECGTMKKGKATTRCLPRKKAQAMTKAERKATVAKKVRGSKKGKQFVKVKENYETQSPSDRELNNKSEKEQLTAVNKRYRSIKFIENPSEVVQLAAVKNQGDALRYIDNPSEAVQLAAIQTDSNAIRLIDNPSEKMQLDAIKDSGLNIAYIKNPTKAAFLAYKNSYSYKGKDKLVPPYKKMHDDLHSKYGNDKKAEKINEILGFSKREKEIKSMKEDFDKAREEIKKLDIDALFLINYQSDPQKPLSKFNPVSYTTDQAKKRGLNQFKNSLPTYYKIATDPKYKEFFDETSTNYSNPGIIRTKLQRPDLSYILYGASLSIPGIDNGAQLDKDYFEETNLRIIDRSEENLMRQMGGKFLDRT